MKNSETILVVVLLSLHHVCLSGFSVQTFLIPAGLYHNHQHRQHSLAATSVDTDGKSRTQRIMEKVPIEGHSSCNIADFSIQLDNIYRQRTGGAGGSSTWSALLRADENWKRLRDSKAFTYDEKILLPVQDGKEKPISFVTSDGTDGNKESWEKLRSQQETGVDFDVVVAGGTLGIFIALAIQKKGHTVCVIEGGKLQGREQEWNISMDELLELVELGVLTTDDIQQAVQTEFPACRAGFKNREETTTGSYFENGIGYECDTDDVLNLGIAPHILIENVKNRFIGSGGVVKESTRIKGIVISENIGASVDIGDSENPVTSRLVLDCMGNASPISRQQRFGKKPDGVCCVVGSCAGGFDAETNVKGDIIYTNDAIQDKGKEGKMQYFWEAFPVGIGRNGKETSDVKTTYMFTYIDADENRPSLQSMMEDYWDLLPIYQPSIQDSEKDLDVKRVLFAYFPTFQDSPLKPGWSRLLAIGDASGIQSPLSFGGFGALTRHLKRLSGAISEALDNDCLHMDDLSKVNAYTPNLSATWMFQNAMSIKMGQKVDPVFINRLLATNFNVMNDMGVDTIKPFLQDVVRVDGLLSSLSGSFVADPTFTPQIVSHVGIPTLAKWLGHVSMMLLYTFNHAVVTPVISSYVDNMKDKRKRFQWRRKMEAWEFGSGSDYILPSDTKVEE